MRQRGRPSADVVALNLIAPASSLAAPAGLNAKERAIFNAIVAAVDPSHFRKSDVPLLHSYVQAVAMVRRLARDGNRIADWEKAARVQAMLATKLRLTPQTRLDAKTVARQQIVSHDDPPPWARVR